MKQQQLPFSGYIEGYFGRVLTWSQRHGIIDTLSALGMNSYLYAPKEDPYHRIKWREPFPDQWQKNLSELAAHGQANNVTVIPAIGPGLSFLYNDDRDFTLLVEKFRQLLNMGMKTVALLMDDIPLELPKECAADFSSLGEAHGKLLHRLLDILIEKDADLELLFCPSVYSDQFVEGRAVDSSYIKELRRYIPRDITLFWTGDRIISPAIDEKSCGDIVRLFENRVVIWDNLYANDYAPNRLFVGAFEGRSLSFVRSTSGIMINPTGLYETDRFLLHHLAAFLGDERDLKKKWSKVSKEFEIPAAFLSVKEFFWLPYTKVDDRLLEIEAVERIVDLYNDLIVPWVHPLKLEWYPWLMALYLDFECIKSKKHNNPQWLQLRYSPFVAQRLSQ